MVGLLSLFMVGHDMASCYSSVRQRRVATGLWHGRNALAHGCALTSFGCCRCVLSLCVCVCMCVASSAQDSATVRRHRVQFELCSVFRKNEGPADHRWAGDRQNRSPGPHHVWPRWSLSVRITTDTPVAVCMLYVCMPTFRYTSAGEKGRCFFFFFGRVLLGSMWVVELLLSLCSWHGCFALTSLDSYIF